MMDSVKSLYFVSSWAYIQCWENKTVVLPFPLFLLYKEFTTFKVDAGFLPNIMKDLYHNIKRKYPDRLYVVIFDELAIKRYLQYIKSQDFIESYEDLGDVEQLMLQGWSSLWQWKLQTDGNLGYKLCSKNMKADDTIQSIYEIIDVLKHC